MRFLIDAQLPPALAYWLAQKGHEAVHVAEALAADAPDHEIFAWVVENDAILISKDHDFLGLFAAPQGSKLVLLKVGNASNRRLEAILESGWPVIEQALLAGEKRCIEWP